MSEDKIKDLPWQITAKKLINFASKFKNTYDEFERQVGYLLLDVGVETLFRVFITQPGVEAKLGYTKRDKIAKGTIEKATIQRDEITLSGFDELAFHKLTEAVNQIAGEKVNNDDLKKAEYFHNIRNKIYHLGDGIIPTKQNFEEYLSLANSLLDALLGVNGTVKNFDLGIDEIEAVFSEFNKKMSYEELETEIAVATEILYPKYATRILEAKIKKLKNLYDEENVRESRVEMIEGFNEVTGTEIHDFKFIEECVNDITYLRLFALLSKTDINKNEIDKYLEYRKWTQVPVKPTNEFTPEYAAKINDYITWRKKITKKIDILIESHINNNPG